VVEALLQNGATVATADTEKHTALDYAKAGNHETVVQALSRAAHK
jgi:ankyrin repeat protein